jgi:TrmH family RNA methyltransferase
VSLGPDPGPGSRRTELITSPDNGRVRAARRLATSSAASRKAGRFLVEGPQAVREAIGAGDVVVEVLLADGSEVSADPPGSARDAARDVAQLAHDRGVVVHRVSPRVLGTISETVTSQGIVAVCERLTPGETVGSCVDSARVLVALDRVQDPGNAGTIIRTADAMAADAVLLSAGSVDVHNGKCVRASAGSVFHIPIVDDVDLASAVTTARANGLVVAATAADADVYLGTAAAGRWLSQPTMWLLGNEASGLAPTLRAAADVVVGVPIPGRAESLNIASAAAVCLYESARLQASTVGRDESV